VAQVVVLDHHKTAAEQLSADSNHPANLAVCVDMERSGAAIARDFFKPELTESLQDVFRWDLPCKLHQVDGAFHDYMAKSTGWPCQASSAPTSHKPLNSCLFVSCRWVEDADLWRWALVPQSRAFYVGSSNNTSTSTQLAHNPHTPATLLLLT
jgi:hypothetical protein